jgi:hypothetical protein
MFDPVSKYSYYISKLVTIWSSIPDWNLVFQYNDSYYLSSSWLVVTGFFLFTEIAS